MFKYRKLLKNEFSKEKCLKIENCSKTELFRKNRVVQNIRLNKKLSELKKIKSRKVGGFSAKTAFL